MDREHGMSEHNWESPQKPKSAAKSPNIPLCAVCQIMQSDLIRGEACLEEPGLRLVAIGLHGLRTQLLNTREGLFELVKPVLAARIVCNPLQLPVQCPPETYFINAWAQSIQQDYI